MLLECIAPYDEDGPIFILSRPTLTSGDDLSTTKEPCGGRLDGCEPVMLYIDGDDPVCRLKNASIHNL